MVGRGGGPYNKIRLDPLKPETYAHPTYNIIMFYKLSGVYFVFFHIWIWYHNGHTYIWYHIWPYIYGHYEYGNLKISFHMWPYYGMVWPYMVPYSILYILLIIRGAPQ